MAEQYYCGLDLWTQIFASQEGHTQEEEFAAVKAFWLAHTPTAERMGQQGTPTSG